MQPLLYVAAKLLPIAASQQQGLSGNPTRVVGSKEDRGLRDVLRLCDAAQRRSRFHGLTEVALGESRSVQAPRSPPSRD